MSKRRLGRRARQPASSNVGEFKPMSLKEIAGKAALTGGPLTYAASVNAGGQAPGLPASSAMSRSTRNR